MVEMTKAMIKDLGLQMEVEEALPYAVVDGAWDGSLPAAMADGQYKTLLNHIVPYGRQLKILFLRVYTSDPAGAKFCIYQTNPTTTGQTGTVEGYPPVGSVPSGVRDYPFLETAGAEVLRGNLHDPVHVCEGSIEFRLLAQFPGAPIGGAGPATGASYGLVWWGVEKSDVKAKVTA